MLKIGDIQLKMPVLQSAISGYSDVVMRRLARQFGVELTFSPVMLDKSVAYRKFWKKPAFCLADDEKPIGGQIVGADPQTMATAAKVLVEKGFDLVDLNFACPAPKVLRRGRGGEMMRNSKLALEIFERVREAVQVPVTLKLRTSYYENDSEREHFWRICEGAVLVGVDALIVHGRAVEQRYRGKADWEVLAQVKQRFSDTVVLGSGDLFKADDVADKMRLSGVDGVVIARGAIGNPWIFRELTELFNGDEPAPPPSVTEVGQVLLQHFNMVTDLYPDHKAVVYFRKFSANYCRRHPKRKKVLLALMACKTAEQVRGEIEQWFFNYDTDHAD